MINFVATYLQLTSNHSGFLVMSPEVKYEMQAGIEGGVHAHKMEEEWDFFLIDAHNTLNEINRTVILWVMCHE